MKRIELPSPQDMTAVERVDEITHILAGVLIRTFSNIAPASAEVGLAFLPEQSVHANPVQEKRLK